MTVGELVQTIQQNKVLSAEQKEKCLNLVPNLDKEHLKELASMMLWLENQNENLDAEEEALNSKVKELFAGMNKYAKKSAKKIHFTSLETKLRKQELGEADSLIQKL